MANNFAHALVNSRRDLMQQLPDLERGDDAAEGGCGVLGFAASLPIAGRHTMTAAAQMNNRGNGKGGGIAMAGLVPEQMGVSAATLRSHTLLQIALLDPSARSEVEQQFITPYFDVAQAYEIDRLDDYRDVPGLEVCPPDVARYFVRVKPAILERFAAEKGLGELPPRAIADEFIYQNSFRLNQAFYASLGEKRAFVLSHGRDLLVLKIVGYAEQVVQYYRLEEMAAYVWIAHQRYPTKGRVWHPAGAHPFIGLNEALVHNGDFANYHAVGEYLRQRNIAPLFLTDTEVSVLLFDLWDRVYNYPLEVTLEAMAPTTEHDFEMLPADKQALYRTIQATHMHGSPDGPWFFILARSRPEDGRHELLGITDTSMLRPQVFALYENEEEEGRPPVQIGLIASERQAINACLRSLSAEDARFQPLADHYWVARGGSYTDGGAFRFVVDAEQGLRCENKFGEPVTLRRGRQLNHHRLNGQEIAPTFRAAWTAQAEGALLEAGEAAPFWHWLRAALPGLTWEEVQWGLNWLADAPHRATGIASPAARWRFSVEILTLLRDRRYDSGEKKRASLLGLVDWALRRLFDRVLLVGQEEGQASGLPLPQGGRTPDGGDVRQEGQASGLPLPAGHRTSESRGHVGQEGQASGLPLPARRVTWESRGRLVGPDEPEELLLLDAASFPPEGAESAANWLVAAYEAGWRRFIAYNWRGGRFAGCGLGPDSDGVRLDLYGDVGDYAASGLAGGEIHLHGDGQDQLGQILKRGRLVIHGDVGQTFLYGAKGGEIFVRGSAAGRPLINAVGRPRAVINGTCLDYLAESFMAGDPLQGGGFVILNGISFDEAGGIEDLPSPYPGGNLFSLASGGAIYIRDPHGLLQPDQLNGGRFAPLTGEDWALIEPYLEENERLFNIPVEALLTVDGRRREPAEVYRMVIVVEGVLTDKENR